MKLERFEIELDNPLAVFYAGTALTGTVVVVLDQPMEMRGVRLHFNGRSYTHWTTTRKSGNTTTTDHYYGHEQYFDHEITIWGNPRGADAPTPKMPAGTHRFQFTYPLPSNCPSSFEGTYGNIRYIVDAKIDRPWKFDHKTKRPFTVLGMLDLNVIPDIATPLTGNGEKELGCLCCVSGQVTCQVHLPKRGYVSGEVVAVNAEISNNSSRELERASLRLVKTVVFRASKGGSMHQKSNEIILAEAIKTETVAPGGSQIWNNEGVRIPPVPLTLTTCSIISIYYTLEFKVTPGGMSFSFSVILPITVGSVPLRQQIPQFRDTFRQFSIDHGAGDPYGGHPPSYPVGGTQPSAPGSDAYPELPPPTYAEATTGKVNIRDESDNEHTRGQLEYAPRYAYFDWSSREAADRPANPAANSNAG